MALTLPILTHDQCAPVLRSIAEPARLRILSALRDGPLPVFALTERLGLKQYQVSRHLGALHELGLVTRERQGKRVVYSLALAVQGRGLEGPTVDLGCCRVSVE